MSTNSSKAQSKLANRAGPGPGKLPLAQDPSVPAACWSHRSLEERGEGREGPPSQGHPACGGGQTPHFLLQLTMFTWPCSRRDIQPTSSLRLGGVPARCTWAIGSQGHSTVQDSRLCVWPSCWPGSMDLYGQAQSKVTIPFLLRKVWTTWSQTRPQF